MGMVSQSLQEERGDSQNVPPLEQVHCFPFDPNVRLPVLSLPPSATEQGPGTWSFVEGLSLGGRLRDITPTEMHPC